MERLHSVSVDWRIVLLKQELADLREEQRHGELHPWAGVCGEDDARIDRIAAIEEELGILQSA